MPAGASTGFARALQRAWWLPRPNALAWGLYPLSLLYEAVAGLRRALVRPQRIGRPVLVVGNLVVGGAGKTPTVLALLRLLRAYGWTPGVVSRGYGRHSQGVAEVGPASRAGEVGDEPLLIHLRSGAPVFVGRDRVAAARALCQAHPEVDIVVADDGLQHHRLARDVQVVVFDERGSGNGMCLPAGPLRQRLPDALPPSTLLLYNAYEPSTPLAGWMATRRLAGVLSLADWRNGRSARPESWDALRGRPIVAAAGIAAPERFFALLREEGLTIDPLPLPDHHPFDTLPWRADAADVIVTEKDAVKLMPPPDSATRIWVAPLDLEPDIGFAAAVKRHFPQAPPR